MFPFLAVTLAYARQPVQTVVKRDVECIHGRDGGHRKDERGPQLPALIAGAGAAVTSTTLLTVSPARNAFRQRAKALQRRAGKPLVLENVRALGASERGKL